MLLVSGNAGAAFGTAAIAVAAAAAVGSSCIRCCLRTEAMVLPCIQSLVEFLCRNFIVKNRRHVHPPST